MTNTNQGNCDVCKFYREQYTVIACDHSKENKHLYMAVERGKENPKYYVRYVETLCAIPAGAYFCNIFMGYERAQAEKYYVHFQEVLHSKHSSIVTMHLSKQELDGIDGPVYNNQSAREVPESSTKETQPNLTGFGS